MNALKSALKSMQADTTNNMAAIRTEIDHMKVGVRDMKGGLWPIHGRIKWFHYILR